MCYIGRLDDDSSVAKLATEDIVVWKVGRDIGIEILAPFRDYIYTNKKYHRAEKLGVSMDCSGVVYIEEGFHSYAAFKLIYMYCRPVSNKCYCKCYIPKGSVYFSNGEEIVSQDLVFVKAYVNAPWYYKLLGIKLKCIYTWKE